MIIPKGSKAALAAMLRNVQEARSSLEALNEDITQRNSELLSTRDDSRQVQERLQTLNNDVLAAESESIYLRDSLQDALDRMIFDEERRCALADEMNDYLENCKNKMAVIAAAIGIDSSAIKITEQKQLQITLPDSKLTTLVFENCKDQFQLASMDPPHPNLELLRMHVEASGDPIGLVLSMFKECS